MPRKKLGERTKGVFVYFTMEQLDLLGDYMVKTGEKNRSHVLNRIIGGFLGRTFFAEIWEQADGHFVAMPAGTKPLPPEMMQKIGAPESHIVGVIDLGKYGMTFNDFDTLVRQGLIPNECLKHIVEAQE